MELARLVVLALLPVLLAAESFTDDLWKSTADLHQKTLAHPFLLGLKDGSLAQEKFRYYLLQDSLYLGEYAKVLRTLASKAPRPEWAAFLNQGAKECLTEEMKLHREYFQPQEVQRAKQARTNKAYTDFLMETVASKDFAEGLAAVLPCYWVYWEVGRALARQGSPNQDYQKWISQYADPGYGKTISAIRSMMDEVARTESPSRRKALQATWRRGVAFELAFWEMAWNRN